MDVAELYDRCTELTMQQPSTASLRFMHETLVLACAEALRNTRQGFGNLFSQVDYLCKHYGVAVPLRMAIQQMRVHSNGRQLDDADDWPYDIKALAMFVSAIFQEDIPHDLLTRLPATFRTATVEHQPRQRVVRCVVTGWDSDYIYATTNEGTICVRYADTIDKEADGGMLTEGVQLNLLDATINGTTVTPSMIVVEPDFLVDISAIAACFQDYGHHPLSYLVNRLKPRANSQQILLGNFAGTALDDIINHPDTPYADTLRTSFREQALQFCTCSPFDAQRFKEDSSQQVLNMRDAVDVLFNSGLPHAANQPVGVYDRERALLEPSFVCELLGLQGRVDLMTDDMRLLVEQKSGKNWNIERGAPQQHKEDHYVQLLLYYGVLRANFQLAPDKVDIRLLYSKYPARQGLLVVNFYQQLFHEAIRQRNCIVAQEQAIARRGFGSIAPLLHADLLLQNPQKQSFFNQYIRGDVERMFQSYHQLPPDERNYVERMFTFVWREQLAQKVGVQEGQGGAVADLWNMPLSEKLESGNILMGTIAERSPEQVVIAVDTADVLPNFRRGDMVFLYRFQETPDVRHSILYKGVLVSLSDREATIRLNERQQNRHLFSSGRYAVEHASSDVGTTSSLRAIFSFCQAPADRRALLLGKRAPRKDATVTLSQSYHPHYDGVLLKAKQSRDYFLLQGPPGTGKTSMALRFLVEEELHSSRSTLYSQLLLTAYTHRAVDEICSMLTQAGLDFLLIGSPDACDQRFVGHLLDNRMGDRPRLGDIRQHLQQARIVVATTSTLQARPFIFQLKHFSLCIVDEASQILEPSIMGVILSEQVERFILIGDHKQLPAVVQQPDDEPRLHDCRRSLFERLLQQEEQAARTDFVGLLRYQGRMHPDIARFPNDFFYRREQLLPVPCPHQLEEQLDYRLPSEDALDDLLKERRVLFIPSQWEKNSRPWEKSPSQWEKNPKPWENTGDAILSDKVNEAEARIVADLLRRICRQYGTRFDANKTVGVIVPYRNQIAMIRREIAQLDLPQLDGISIDTVERYQGSQRDVIIYSFTVRRPYQLDFLTANSFEEVDETSSKDGQSQPDSHIIDRKLNVAMTRARKQLIMTGNAPLLSRNNIFSALIARYSI